MNNHEIIARSTKLGAITREFKESLENFSKDIRVETAKINDAITYAGDSGWSGELYSSFQDKFKEKMEELNKLAKQASDIAARLEVKAEKYDIIIDYYKKAGM